MDLTMKGLPAVAVKKAQASVSAKAMSLSQLDVKVGKSRCIGFDGLFPRRFRVTH